jgi:PAS domain S-box-containing protein
MGRPNDGEGLSPALGGASAAAAELRARRLQLWLLTACAVLVLLGAVSWFEWHERDQELDAATSLSKRRAARLAGDLEQALALARVAITQEEARLAAAPAGSPVRDALDGAALERAQLLAVLPIPFQLHALDAQGHPLGLVPGSLRAAGHGHEHVMPLPGAADAGWQVGSTQGAAGSRVVPLARRAAPNAHGVAAFVVDLDHAALLRRLDRAREPLGSGAALFRIETDGSVTVLARAPHVESELGKRLRGPLAQALVRSPRGVFEGVAQIDGARRVVAYERLDGAASRLMIAYGMDTDPVLAGWTAQLPLVAVVTLLLAGGMLWGGRRLDQSLQSMALGQQALQRSENHFRALADNLPDVVVRFDTEGRHLYANAAVEGAAGLPPAAFIGKTNADLGMPAHNVDTWTATLQRIFAGGATERLEFEFAGPQGLRHWESVVAREPALPGAAPTALVISRDVTDRVDAQREREGLSRHLVGLLDGMSDAFVSLDRQWCYRYVNRKAGEIFGRDPASLTGKHIWTEFPDGVGQPFQRACERAMNEVVAIQLEEYYPPFDAWFENRIQPTADGISIFFTDITERKRRESELKQLHATLDALVEGSTDAVYVKDLRGRYIVANRATAKLLDRSVADILGADDRALFPAEVAARFRADDQRVMQSRSTETYEETLATANGPRHQLRTKGALLIDGAISGVFGISRDITERTLAVERLRDSEERLRLALQAANQGLYDLDVRTGQTVVSPEYARMLGYEPEEFQESNAAWRERLHPDDRVGVYQAYEDYVAGRVAEYRVEFRQRTKNGQWKWILSLGKVQQRDADGQPLRMLGTHTDITATRQAQAALRASEARLAYLLRSSPTVIYTAAFGGDYGATYYSPNLRGMLGWEPAQFIEDPGFWLAHVHADDRDAVLAQLDGLNERDELVLEYRFGHADGSWRWMRDAVRLARDTTGAPIELVGSWIDITERRQAEDEARRLAAQLEQRVRDRTAELARSEARLRKIFDTVPVSIGEEDWTQVQRLLRELRDAGVTDGPAHFAAHPEFVQQCLQAVRVVQLNRKALSLHDAQDKDAQLPDLKAFYPSPDDLPQFVGELEALWQGERLYTAKKSLPSVAGRPLRLMMTMSLPGLDADDGTALVCLVDISEIDRLNAELDRSLARLRQANQELETFTYSVSHDLKAPLRGIDGYSRLLLTDHQAQLDDEGRRFLGHIRQATQHMGVLIDDLLAYSRLERRDLTLASVRLSPLVDALLAPYRQLGAASGLEVELEIDPELHARADAQGLTIALRNLVDNAVKFSRHSRPPRIRIVATRMPGGVELAVHDNGLGFDMKFHDRIFGIFQRLHRAEDYPGTGVGLAIVRKAMQRMGGRVWAESRPGHGATFTLELPEAS